MKYKLEVKNEVGDKMAGVEFDEKDELGLITQALSPTILRNGVTVEVSVNETNNE